MQTAKFSKPILSTSEGWFRYNYDRGCLEFLNHTTKTVVHTWIIPVDQWEELPSQREYCENIVREAQQQQQSVTASNQQAKKTFQTSLLVAIISGGLDLYWYFTDATVDYRIEFIIGAVCMIAVFIASSSYHKSKR